ncbi:MAG TPA: hypothetical protein VNW47_17955 [Terriglobales bacterium]|jgi:hypothetical protein|nr:hypothetical protein [Terriglobales bacterium]
MGYYIRVLGQRDIPLLTETLRNCLPPTPKVELSEERSDQSGWSQLILRHTDGTEIALVERNLVIPGELGAEEIEEFIDEVQDALPTSSSKWLLDYLPSVVVIYAFQLLGGTDVNDGWNAVHALRSYIWKQVGGISQADLEGFSNEQGHHILWQFNESVTGEWDMAVLDEDGNWLAFTMDLGNPEHRRAFVDGRMPAGLTAS